MLVTVLADNLGILWIAMEGTTITSALLVGFHGDKHGLEAAWKYIIVTTIGISFGLFGTVLIYGAAAHAQGGVFAGAMNWSSIIAIAPDARPGHRAHRLHLRDGGLRDQGGPRPGAHVAARRAQPGADAGLGAALGRAHQVRAVRDHPLPHHCARRLRAASSPGVLLAFGLVSVVVATPFIIVQHDLKRLLGYHSVEHVGIIALGLWASAAPLGTYGGAAARRSTTA